MSLPDRYVLHLKESVSNQRLRGGALYNLSPIRGQTARNVLSSASCLHTPSHFSCLNLPAIRYTGIGKSFNNYNQLLLSRRGNVLTDSNPESTSGGVGKR